MLGLSNGSNEIIAEPSEDKKQVLQSNTVSGDRDQEQRDGLRVQITHCFERFTYI